MKRILCVDDEVEILRALKRVFILTDYEIFTASSAEEAFIIMRDNEIDMIISDMRMPEVDGYKLLSQVKMLYPDIIRIMLSGYSDEKLIIKAVQENIVKSYIFKPWENKSLLGTVERIFKLHDDMKGKNIEKIVEKFHDIPTISRSYKSIKESIEEDLDFDIIAELIERDSAITAKILRIANSAFYGINTADIKKAITYLGMNNIRDIVMSTSIFESFERNYKSKEIYKKIWKHSFLTNKIMDYLYREVLKKPPSEIYITAGLMHNIGLIPFLQKFEKEMTLIFEDEYKESKLIELEEEKMGVNHRELGAYLLQWWGFPYPVVEATMYCTDIDNEYLENKEVIAILDIAREYAWEMIVKKVIPKKLERESMFLDIDLREIDIKIKELYKDAVETLNI